MRIARRTCQAIALISWTSLCVACGVGPYHIPDVEPVVKPEPEENLLAEFGLEDMDAESTEEGSEEGGEGESAGEAETESESTGKSGAESKAPAEGVKKEAAAPADEKPASDKEAAEGAKPKK